MAKQMETDTGVNIEDFLRSDGCRVSSSSAFSSSSGVAGDTIKTEEDVLNVHCANGNGHHNKLDTIDVKEHENRSNAVENADVLDGDKESVSNNGRWTKSEHELFLRGMSLWGRDWKKVQSAVKVIV